MAAFTFSNTLKNLLFEGINISSTSGIIIVCSIMILLSGLYEVIHFLRQYLIYKIKLRCQSPTESSQLCGTAQPLTTSVKIQIHCSQSVLHILQVFIGYVIMLCVMKFNAYIFLTVILSMGVGFFFLGTFLTKYLNYIDEVCLPNADPTNEKRSYASISKEDETVIME